MLQCVTYSRVTCNTTKKAATFVLALNRVHIVPLSIIHMSRFSNIGWIHNPTGVVCVSVMWCRVVWCNVVWCGVVWCGLVWYGVVWCDVEWYGVLRCALLCCVVWSGVVLCGLVW